MELYSMPPPVFPPKGAQEGRLVIFRVDQLKSKNEINLGPLISAGLLWVALGWIQPTVQSQNDSLALLLLNNLCTFIYPTSPKKPLSGLTLATWEWVQYTLIFRLTI